MRHGAERIEGTVQRTKRLALLKDEPPLEFVSLIG